MDGVALRSLLKNKSFAERLEIVEKIIDRVRNKKLNLDDISLRECFHGFVGDVSQERVNRAIVLRESLQSTAFPTLTGNLVLQMVLKAYEEEPSILDNLVTTMKTSFRTEPIAAMGAYSGIRDVPELSTYPFLNSGDRATLNPEPNKRGGIIAITAETILHDQTGQVRREAELSGKAMKADRELSGIKNIEDATSYKSYYPVISGTPTQTNLYRAAAASANWYDSSINLKATNGLSDWSNVDAALTLLANMRDEAGNPFINQAKIILVPRALWATALQIIGATELRSGTDGTTNVGFATVTVSANILKLMASMVPLTSNFMTSSSDWFLGDFKRQFVEREIMPISIDNIGPDESRDIVMQLRLRRKSNVVATDDKFVIKNTA